MGVIKIKEIGIRDILLSVLLTFKYKKISKIKLDIKSSCLWLEIIVNFILQTAYYIVIFDKI